MNRKLQEFKKYIKGRKAAVIGVGISNRPLIKWLCSLGADVTGFDRLSEDDPILGKTMQDFNNEGLNIKWSLGENYLDRLASDDFDIVFKTPKMRFETPELAAAYDKGAVLTTEMELFLSLCPAHTFGITGSDGKTTTTTLVSEMLKTAGYRVWLGGNIGTPLLEKIGEIEADDMVVLELSSFQLLGMASAVDTAIVTNITPNHLDFHKDYAEYIDAKKSIFRNQSASGLLILNGKCDITFDMWKERRGRLSFFARNREDTLRAGDSDLFAKAYCENGVLTYEYKGIKSPVIHEKEIFIPGKHNVENYLAAMSAVFEFVGVEDIVKVAKNFKGVAHRIEFIREIDGVKYYNSSIDTSPNRTINTMNALRDRAMKGVLIAGGADKKCIYDGLGDAILNVCDRIILYGSNSSLVEDILAKEANGRSYSVTTLESVDGDVYEFEATRDKVRNNYVKAVELARSLAKPGEIVIMSNIGTSYDHFRHFEHRGDMFKEIVNEV